MEERHYLEVEGSEEELDRLMRDFSVAEEDIEASEKWDDSRVRWVLHISGNLKEIEERVKVIEHIS